MLLRHPSCRVRSTWWLNAGQTNSRRLQSGLRMASEHCLENNNTTVRLTALGGMQGRGRNRGDSGRPRPLRIGHPLQNAFLEAVDNPFGSPSFILSVAATVEPGTVTVLRIPQLPERRSIGTRESRNFVSDHGLFRACQGLRIGIFPDIGGTGGAHCGSCR